MLKIEQNWGKIANYLPQCSKKIGTPGYMYDSQPLTNSNSIAQAVDDAVRSLESNRNSIYLLLSDAAKYMVTGGALLKSLYPKLLHVHA